MMAGDRINACNRLNPWKEKQDIIF
jgi:hypothetical protein